jgi:type I restriction enzyme S subunit
MEVKPGYKQTESGVIPQEWDAEKLGNFISLQRGHDLTWRDRRSGDIPVIGSAGQNGFHDTAIVKGPGVVLGRSGASFGQAHYCEQDFWPHNTALYVTDFRSNDPLFVFYFLSAIDFSRHNSGGAQQSLNRNFIASVAIGVPRPVEQRAIATALSDMAALLGALERLIAKKRDLKQAAMQQLLTGQTRLPGFCGEWGAKSFSSVLTCVNAKTHQIQTSEYQATGKYPVVDQGKEVVIGFSDKEEKRFRCSDGGVIVFGDHTCIVKFIDFDFLVGADGTQVLHAKEGQSTRFHAFQLQYRGVEPTGYNRHFKFLKERHFLVPSLAEQTAIATVLADMDAELTALEQRLAKTRDLKQAMMQELLTGKTRLVTSEAPHA